TRRSLMKKILRNPFSSKKKPGEVKKEKINRKEIYVLHPDEASPNYRFDTCCSPIPGDDVLGFVDDDENVILHKVSCPNAMRLKSAFGSRLVATKWGGTAENFIATISIDGIDRHGILEEISSTVSKKLQINIRGLSIAAKQEVFHCDLTVQVDNADTVEVICDALKKIKDIKFARRSS
ncbi:MAG: GTP pyrophosphokinase, partial [Muribaculaceae bacterium]|nr:GTP pyrophosphokinase [Muribaculaceae bacterium]